jgi:chemotaxis protein MotB
VSRRGRRGGHEEEHVNHERWMASYMDMVTVMMCLFIVLYAIGQVDEQKFIELKSSLAASFGAPSTTRVEVVDGGTGVLTSDAIAPDAEDVANQAGGPVAGADRAASLQLAAREAEELDALREEIAQALAARDLAGDVEYAITERGLVVGLVSGDVFFGAESAELSPQARGVIDTLSGVLAPETRNLSVEGHANVLPTSGRYATNWELSADRATTVLRRMVESGRIASDRIRAVGFGDAHPVDAPGQDPLTVNRRVDVVVESGAPESVRALIPDAAAALPS